KLHGLTRAERSEGFSKTASKPSSKPLGKALGGGCPSAPASPLSPAREPLGATRPHTDIAFYGIVTAGRFAPRPTEYRVHETHAPSPSRLQVLCRTDRLRDRARPHRRGRTERLRQIQSGRGAALGDGRDLAQIAA